MRGIEPTPNMKTFTPSWKYCAFLGSVGAAWGLVSFVAAAEVGHKGYVWFLLLIVPVPLLVIAIVESVRTRIIVRDSEVEVRTAFRTRCVALRDIAKVNIVKYEVWVYRHDGTWVTFTQFLGGIDDLMERLRTAVIANGIRGTTGISREMLNAVERALLTRPASRNNHQDQD